MKRWIKWLVLSVVLVLPTWSYGQAVRLNIQPASNQIIAYDRGASIIRSEMPKSKIEIVIGPNPESGFLDILFVYYNDSQNSVNFGLNNILLKDQNDEIVSLVSYDQLYQDEMRRQRRENFGNRLSALGRELSSQSSNDTPSSGIYSSTTTGLVGHNIVTLHSSGIVSLNTTNNQNRIEAERQAMDLNERERSQLDVRQLERISRLENMLRITTVHPNQVHGGVVRLPLKRSMWGRSNFIPITIDVTVGDETHSYVGRIER